MELLTAKEVAGLWRVSPKTVIRWARSGRLPSIALGARSVRFDRGEMERWFETRKEGT